MSFFTKDKNLFFDILSQRILEESNRFEMEISNNPFVPKITANESFLSDLFIRHCATIDKLINVKEKDNSHIHSCVMGVGGDVFYIRDDLVEKSYRTIHEFLNDLLVHGLVWEPTPTPYTRFQFPIIVILYSAPKNNCNGDNICEKFQCHLYFFNEAISDTEIACIKLFEYLKDVERFAAIHVIDNARLICNDEHVFETIRLLSIQLARSKIKCNT